MGQSKMDYFIGGNGAPISRDACMLSLPRQLRVLRSMRWHRGTGWYLAYRLADYVVLNLGEDAAMVAFMFC